MMALLAAAAAMSIGDVALLGVGFGSLALAVFAVAAFRLSSLYETREAWAIIGERQPEPAEPTKRRGGDSASIVRMWGITAAAGAAVFAAGAFLSWSGDIIAERSGLGQSYVGFLLVGVSTSLPEVTTVIAAYRLERYEMATGSIFGTNIFNTGLLLFADAVHRGGPLLGEAGPFEVVGALLAALMTGVFLLGLLERRNRTILRMGYDSAAVILLFLIGAALLFPLSQI